MMQGTHKTLIARYYEEIVNQHRMQVFDDLFAPAFIARSSNGPEVKLDRYKEILGMSISQLLKRQVNS
jgi:hypothetical protein